jgi:hypothetical protein
VPSEQSSKWNVKRGLIRLWVLFTTVWLATAGGIWVTEWSNELAQLGRELVRSVTPAIDYEALCAKLRAQRGAGGSADAIPAIPALELVVENGIGKVIAAPGRCLVVFAKEEGIGLVPVAFKIVGGDGSTLREIEDKAGNRRPITDFSSVPRIERVVSNSDRRTMFESFAFIVGVPMVLFGLGSGIRWAVMGFRLR